MTPDQKPYWAGTYLPPRGQGGRLGLVELLGGVERLWRLDRDSPLGVGQPPLGRRSSRRAYSSVRLAMV